MAALLFTVLTAAAGGAQAQITEEAAQPYPDPRKFARGLYLDADAGALVFVGPTGGQVGPGMGVGLKVGYDLFRWAAIQVCGFGSTHRLIGSDVPQAGQLLQLYQGSAQLKLSAQLGQWGIAAFGGAGIAQFSTNVLGTLGLTDADLRTTLAFGGGIGGDYHTLSHHFSFGLDVAFVNLAKLSSPGVLTSTLHARYTF